MGAGSIRLHVRRAETNDSIGMCDGPCHGWAAILTSVRPAIAAFLGPDNANPGRANA